MRCLTLSAAPLARRVDVMVMKVMVAREQRHEPFSLQHRRKRCQTWQTVAHEIYPSQSVRRSIRHEARRRSGSRPGRGAGRRRYQGRGC